LVAAAVVVMAMDHRNHIHSVVIDISDVEDIEHVQFPLHV
jgi:hypothetical protein